VMFRQIFASLKQSGATKTVTPPKTGGRVFLLIGVYVACFSWLINVAWFAGDQLSAAIITAVTVLLAMWQFFRVNRSGSHGAALRVTCQHLALVWGVILVTLNWRLDTWMATIRGIDLAAMHRLLPAWVVPSLTLALVSWVGVLLAITRPDDSDHISKTEPSDA
jgi:hypothetical protein